MAHQSQGHRSEARPGRRAQQPRRDAPQYIARADAFQRPCRKGETQIENTARQSADQDRLGGRPLPRCCNDMRSEEHTSELQSLMRISYDVFCLKKKRQTSSTMTSHKST